MARYSAHHRSLYPHLESVRGHYLLTSHAGTPLACWDRRWVWAEETEGHPLVRAVQMRASTRRL